MSDNYDRIDQGNQFIDVLRHLFDCAINQSTDRSVDWKIKPSISRYEMLLSLHHRKCSGLGKGTYRTDRLDWRQFERPGYDSHSSSARPPRWLSG